MLLLTGFEPFNGSAVNPSQQVASALDGAIIDGLCVRSMILPVERQRGPETLLEAVKHFQPSAVLCLGQAARASVVAVERVAVNLLDFRIADNSGIQITDEPVVPGGPAAYFATLPVRAMAEAIRAGGVPCDLSLSAGAFLCNQVMYTLLHHAASQDLRMTGGFIHLPSLPEQALQTSPASPSMSFETSLRAVRAAIHVIAANR